MADLPRSPVSLSQDFADTKPNISAMAQQFIVARDTQSHDKAVQESFDQRQDEIKLGQGIVTRDQVTRLVNLARIPQADQAENGRKSKQHDNQLVFMSLLDQIRDRAAELQDRMAERYEALKATYGDDVVSGMVDTFLNDEERAGLGTDEDKLKALADKFLDENGAIRDDYKHLDEAVYIRDWNEAQTLKPLISNLENFDNLSQQEKLTTLRTAGSLPNVDSENLALATSNINAKEALSKISDHSKADNEVIKISSVMTFE